MAESIITLGIGAGPGSITPFVTTGLFPSSAPATTPAVPGTGITPALVFFTTTAAEYFLKLLDHDGAVVAQFAGGGRGLSGGGLQAFSYRRRLRTPGAATVRVYGNDDRVRDYLVLDPADGAGSHLDYQWEFYRSDPAIGLSYYKDFEVFHRKEEFNQEQSGRYVFISYGQGYNIMLYAEVVRAAEGSAGAAKSGDVAAVARAYVEENIGPSAGVDGLGNSRVMPGLTVAASPALGKTWQGDRADKLLSDVLDELAEYGPGDYMILGSGPAAFTFTWRNTRWGDDKTRGNTAGNAPVVFSPELGNMESVSAGYSHLDEVNAAYVLGQGVGALQKVRTAADAALLALSPWARRAVTRSSRNSYSDDEMDALGAATIAKQRPKRTLSFTARQTPATRYGRDWDLGDLVTAVYLGREHNLKVVGVTVGWSSDGRETITPELESEVAL